jgi:predicted MFS family arabinose efflux permease
LTKHEGAALPALTPGRERLFLLTLAAVQFSHIVDFMVMMPLGPFLMQGLGIDTKQFGLLVASYSFCAAASGLLAAGFIDRYERKRLILILFALFALATLACGLATSYAALLVARGLAGVFGGILGSMVQTQLADAIPFSRRATAGGVVATAFSVSTVAGVPLSLWLAEAWGWRAPFLMIAGLGILVWIAGCFWLPVLDGHRDADGPRHPLAAIRDVLGDAGQRRSMLFSAAMIFSGFTVIPYLTVYSIGNAGVLASQIPLIYLAGGLATLFTARRIGRWADRIGKLQAFRWLALAAMAPILALTHVHDVGLAGWLPGSIAFFVLVSGRMIPAMALISSAVDPARRGAAMSLNSTVQSLAMGAASSLAGFLITQGADGRFANFDQVGYIAVAAGFLSMALAGRVTTAPRDRPGCRPA